MTPLDLDALAEDLCRIFVGWKLREDEPALRALGEGALRLDLRTGEAWCDGDPLPTLFIAEELRRELDGALEAEPRAEVEAVLEAVFEVRPAGLTGPRVETLQVGSACRLRIGNRTGHGEARRRVAD
ncbi:MAG: hypothetical protein OEP95_15630 [Myxococcales bacterium]|nr:hypothetical protein [Myxococcales bacterium]